MLLFDAKFTTKFKPWALLNIMDKPVSTLRHMILAGTENDEEVWVRDCYEHPVEDNMKCEQHLERGILVDVCFCSDDLCNSMMGTIPTQTSTLTSTTSDSIGKCSHHQNI